MEIHFEPQIHTNTMDQLIVDGTNERDTGTVSHVHVSKSRPTDQQTHQTIRQSNRARCS